MSGDDINLTSTDALRYCEDGVCQCFPADISGKWKLRPKAGSMGVGRAEGNISDWFATDFVWGTERACLWDDEYIFKATNSNNPQTGSFSQIMGDSTWLEPWQSPNGVEECGTPQSPFDGSTSDMSYNWTVEKGTLTLFGYGAHIGLPRVANNAENTGAVPFDVPTEYTIETASDNLITLNIKSSSASPWWHFELEKFDSVDVNADADPDAGADTGSDDVIVELEGITIDPDENTITINLSGSPGTIVPSTTDFQITQSGVQLVVDAVVIQGNSIVLSTSNLADAAIQVSYTPSGDAQALSSFNQMIVSDGYIRDAEVYADANNNGIGDESELIEGLTTDVRGQLLISDEYSYFQIIIKGGVNVDTGAINQLELTAPAGYSVINPLSTLVQEIIASDETQTLDQAEAVLTQALGITLAAGEDLSSYDPISDVSENAIANRVATTQIATVLAAAAASSAANTSDESNIEAVVLENLVELVTTSSEQVTLDAQTVGEVLSDANGSLVSTEELNTVTSAVDAMETIKQDAGSVVIEEALGQLIQAQAEAIDNVKPASPTLSVNAGELKISFDTTIKDGSAVIAGDTVELFENDVAVANSSYVLKQSDIAAGYYNLQLSQFGNNDTQYNAKITDIAGNVSSLSSPIIIDTTAPIITSVSSTNPIDENSGAGQTIYTATANETVNFSLAAGSDNGVSINSITGAVTLAANPDFETQSQYSFTVIATDASGNGSAAHAVTVDVNNIDEVAPTITSGAVAQIDENSSVGQIIYTAIAIDSTDDVVDTPITYSLAVGSDTAISIDVSTGAVTLNTISDFEAQSEYSFTVIATDASGNASAEQSVTLGVINLDEVAPTITSGDSVSVLETAEANTVVYVATAIDTDDISAGVSFSLSNDSDTALTINSETGEVTLTDKPDFAVKPSYSFTVIANDGVNQSQIAVTLSVVDKDLEAPVFTSSATKAIDENIGANQVVYTAVATDDFVITYSLDADTNNGLSIDSTSGEVTLDVNPDYETQSEYSFTVIATDSSDNSSQLTVSLSVNFIDTEAPVITSAATGNAIDENSGANQTVYTAVATDDSAITYSLANTDLGFSINASTGVVTTDANFSADYEAASSQSFTVVVTDAASNSSQQVVTVAINDLVETNTFGPVDMTMAFGDATIVDTGEEPYYFVDSSLGNGFAGYAYNFTAEGYETNPLLEAPLTFGSGGTVTFTASIPSDQTLSAADIRFKFEKQASETGDSSVTDPSCFSETITVNGSDSVIYTVEMPVQADRTFANIVMYLDTSDTNVLISNIMVTPSAADSTVEAVDCGLYGRQGPLDMTGAYGNGAVSGDNGEFFMNDTSLGFDYSGFANLVTELYPFEFGTGGTLEFTASVPTGEEVDVSFQLQKQSSADGLLCEYGPVWDSPATTVSSATDQTFTLDIPAQGGDTFSNMIMLLSEDNINVKITDVYVTTSQKTDDAPTVPAECDGSLDMTGAYGNGAVSGEGDLAGKLFMNDTSLGQGFSGFANTTLTDLDGNDIYPFEFGTGGTLEFTASVPEGQSTTAVDVKFQFQKQASSTGKFCDIAPIWEATRTVSGPVDETFTVAIPSQSGDTFSNLIMELSVDDVLVKISGVKVTPSAKTNEAQSVPAECEASPLPSIYPENGINTAAMFDGTFGDEEGGSATIQDYDTYEFPTASASYGGWANGNETLYPITYSGGGFFAQKKIYFCASTTEAATVYFRFENDVYPANTQIFNTAEVSLTADGVMRAYSSNVSITYAVKSLLFLMLERDTPITMGKVMGNWNGLPLQDITTDSDGDGVVDYCEDFPNLTPDWVDTDGDGASDEVDAFPDDATQWEAATP
jgi:hypothetical protein